MNYLYLLNRLILAGLFMLSFKTGHLYAKVGYPGANSQKQLSATDDSANAKLQQLQGMTINSSLFFIENKGQITDQNGSARNDIQFRLAATNGLNIFIGDGAIHYQFNKCDNPQSSKYARKRFPDAKSHAENYGAEGADGTMDTMYRMDVELVGANKNARVIAEGKQNYYENYYTAPIGVKGVTANAYKRIVYKDIYPNIDWVLYMEDKKLKHEFVIHEGGKVSDIKLKYGGATGLAPDKDGNLIAETPQGTITEQAPYSYDENKERVACDFTLQDSILSYTVASYSGTLVIDPTLAWATYFGGSAFDVGWSLATDGPGNVYMSGATSSTSAIATTGAYQTTFGGVEDAFLAKFNSTGSLVWATYYGGTGADGGEAVAADGSGNNVYMAGFTSSTSGIATPGAYHATYGGGMMDAFLAKFTSTGSLVWATYYGGSNQDAGVGVASDASGTIYMAGYTSSTSGIATPGAYQTSFAGGTEDAFLAKFSSTGSLLWSTYYGGNGDDLGYKTASDGTGNVYITGNTSSLSSIATPGAYQATYGGGSADGFLAKFNSTGSLLWATYYGGSGGDDAAGVATDGSGNVCITGGAGSSSAIASPGAYQATYGGMSDAYIAKFDSSGARLWATYYGGSNVDNGLAITTDDTGNIYINGETRSTSAIATPGAYQPALGGGYDAYVAKFNGSGAMQWASYYGGTIDEVGYGIAADGTGNVYICGQTQSTSAITTTGAYQTTYGGGGADGFLAKFGPATTYGAATVCVGGNITLTGSPPGGTWSSSNTAIGTVGSISGVVTGVAAGVDTIYYTTISGTTSTIVTVNANPAPISGVTGICVGTTTTFTDATPGGTWSISPSVFAIIGSSSGIVTPIFPGCSTITYTVGSCYVTYGFCVNPFPILFTVTGGGMYCAGGTGVNVGLSGSTTGVTYQLYNGTTAIGMPIAGTGSALSFGLQTVAGTYTVVATITATGCSTTMSGSAAVAINPLPMPYPLYIGTPGIDSICSGATGNHIILGGSTTGINYQLYMGGAPLGAPVPGTGGMIDFGAFTAPGIYSVIAVNTFTGCVNNMGPVSIHTAPTAISGPGSVCVGAMINLTDATGGGMWTSSNAHANVGSISGVVTGVSTGTSTITYTLTTGCYVAKTITVNTTASTISGTLQVCQGSTTALSDTASGAVWSSSTTAIAAVGSLSGIVTGVSAGTATITCFPTGGCLATAVVTVNALPTLYSMTGGGIHCAGGCIHVGLTGSTIGQVFQFYWGTIALFPLVAGTGGPLDFGCQSAAGTYTCVAMTSAGCTRAMTGSATISITPAPGPITGPSAVCAGATVTETDTTTGGTWSSVMPAIASIGSATGIVTGHVIGTTTIVYTLPSGCLATKTVTVSAAPGTISGAPTVCTNDSTTLTDATGGGVWTSSAITKAIVGSSTGVVTGISGGAVMITYSLGTGCIATKAMTVNAGPAAITGTMALCAGSSTTPGMTTTGGVWTSGAIGVATVGSTGVVHGVSAGTAGITYTLTNGCKSKATVTVNALPAISAGPGASICSGSSATLTATGGTTYTWSPATGLSATTGATVGASPTATITYTVTGMLAGCSGIATNIVTVNAVPTISAGSWVIICSGSSTTLTATGGTTYTWSPPTGLSATTGATVGASPTATITYTVTGTTAGCSGTATKAVTVNTIAGTISGAGSVCAGATTTLTDSSPGGIWSSSNTAMATVGSVSGVVYGVSAGTVTITYTTTYGCKATLLMTINPIPSAITGASSTMCVGRTITLSDATPGGAWSSSNMSIATVSTTGVVTGVSGGNATISYTLSTGCAAIRTVSVTAVPAITGLHNLCAWGDTVTVHDSVVTGLYSSTLVTAVNLGGGTGRVTSYAAGIGTVSYTLPSGCFTSATVTVYPIPGLITGTTHIFVGGTTTLSNSVAGGSWSSGAPTIATVGSATGLVTGVSAGTAHITYTLPTGCDADTVVHVAAARPSGPRSTMMTSGGEIRVIPNPNKGAFTISGTLGTTATQEEEVWLELTDMLGQVVYKNKVLSHEGKIEEDVLPGNIASGMYLLSVRWSDGNKVMHVVVGK